MKTHRGVLTAGTSVLTGRNHYARMITSHRLFRVDGPSVSCAGDDEAKAMAAWKHELGQLDLPDVAALPGVSAECAIVRALQLQRKLAEHFDVALIHSATFAGEAAARLVAHVLTRLVGAEVQLRRAADLDVEDSAGFARSLGNLMAAVRTELSKGEPLTTCFAPIGGYKVMAALGYVAGSIGGYPMAYLHERTQALHFVPPIPVVLDTTVVAQHAVLFRKLHRDTVDMASLSGDEQAAIRSYPFLFELADELVNLSPFGVFALTQASPSALETRVLMSAQARTLLDAANSREFVAKELRRLCELLREPDRNRSLLHHEADFGISRTGLALFKGASGRAGVFRAAYEFDAEGDRLSVHTIWLDHDKYEREAPARVAVRSSGAELVDVTHAVHSLA